LTKLAVAAQEPQKSPAAATVTVEPPDVGVGVGVGVGVRVGVAVGVAVVVDMGPLLTVKATGWDVPQFPAASAALANI